MTHRYTAAADGWLAFITPARQLFVGTALDAAVIDKLWARMRDERGPAGILEALTANGLFSTPPFAFVEAADGSVNAIVRGEAVVRAGAEQVSGAGATTWIERRLPGGSVGVTLTGSGSVELPIEAGVVRAAAFATGSGSVSAPAAAPAAPARRSPRRPPSRRPSSRPPPSRRRPPRRCRARAGTGASARPATEAEPVSEETVSSVDEVGLPPAADAASEPEPSTGGYDYLFGDTMYRSVEDAAVRPEEPAEEGAEVSVDTADEGDHDGSTVLASSITRTRGGRRPRGDAPAPPAPPSVVVVLPNGTREPLDQAIVLGRSPSVSKVPGGAASAARHRHRRRPGHLAQPRAVRGRGRHRRRHRPALAQRHHDRAARQAAAEAARRRADLGASSAPSSTSAAASTLTRARRSDARVPPRRRRSSAGYEFVRVLGSGGFSDVFLYEQELPSAAVAVKVLLLDETHRRQPRRVRRRGEPDGAALRAPVHRHDLPRRRRLRRPSVLRHGVLLRPEPRRALQAVSRSPSPMRCAPACGSRARSRHGPRGRHPAPRHQAGERAHQRLRLAGAHRLRHLVGRRRRAPDRTPRRSPARSPTPARAARAAQSVGMSRAVVAARDVRGRPAARMCAPTCSRSPRRIYTLLAGQHAVRDRRAAPTAPSTSSAASSAARSRRWTRTDIPRSLIAVLQKGMATEREDRFASASTSRRALQRVEMELGYAPTDHRGAEPAPRDRPSVPPTRAARTRPGCARSRRSTRSRSIAAPRRAAAAVDETRVRATPTVEAQPAPAARGDGPADRADERSRAPPPTTPCRPRPSCARAARPPRPSPRRGAGGSRAPVAARPRRGHRGGGDRGRRGRRRGGRHRALRRIAGPSRARRPRRAPSPTARRARHHPDRRSVAGDRRRPTAPS